MNLEQNLFEQDELMVGDLGVGYIVIDDAAFRTIRHVSGVLMKRRVSRGRSSIDMPKS